MFARSSSAITSWSRTRRVLALWRKSVRAAQTLRWARRFRCGFGAVRGPALAAAMRRCTGPGSRPAFQVPGVGDPLPPLVTAKSLMPRSRPTTRPVAGNCPGRVRRRRTRRTSVRTGHGTPSPRRVDRRRVHIGPGPRDTSGVSIFARNSAASRPGTRTGVLRGRRPLPGLHRAYLPAGEERGVRGLLVADRLLGYRGHLVQPRQFFRGLLGQVGAGLVQFVPAARVVPLVLTPASGSTPQDAADAKHAAALCRVRPHLYAPATLPTPQATPETACDA